jgi:integrase
MPKPLFLTRRSGLYARFLVPLDLRQVVGSHFLVRPLYAVGDGARLVAAHMGLALSRSFAALRQGEPVDIKKALEAAAAAGRKDLTLKGVTLPNGTRLDHIEIHNESDAQLFSQALEDIGRFSVVRSPIEETPKSSSAPLLSVAIEVHVSDLTGAKRDAKTILESRHTLRLLLGIVGDRSVDAVTQNHIRAFYEGARSWPRNGTRVAAYKGKSVAEIIALARAEGVSEPAAHTMNKHRQRLAVFFNALRSAKVITHSPLDGLPAPGPADAETQTGRPFTEAELKRIFDPARFLPWASQYPHRWWGPMLGLYTGARVNEIGQLYVADVETIDGVTGIHIAKRFPGQKLKTRSSLRFVPAAQALLDAGFLDFVEDVRRSGHERLFPHLPNGTGLGFGKQLTKQFSAYVKRLGIRDTGVGFHAFRHTFSTALDRAGMEERRIAWLTGHLTSQSVLGRFYIDPPSLPERVATLAAFKPPVVLPTYEAGQFNDALRQPS